MKSANRRSKSWMPPVAPRDARATTRAVVATAGVAIGTIEAVSERGDVRVDFLGNPTGRPLPARTTVAIGPKAVGREVALAFVGGDPKRPIVLGILGRSRPARRLDVTIDGKATTIRATDELTLECGAARITLTRAGKVLISGCYVLTRSSGVNRVVGASVQLN